MKLVAHKSGFEGIHRLVEMHQKATWQGQDAGTKAPKKGYQRKHRFGLRIQAMNVGGSFILSHKDATPSHWKEIRMSSLTWQLEN